jgi:oxygen-independent coproporphyrinogen-3 oxidase
VQDFHYDVQKKVNRVQPFELVARVVEDTRKVGIDSINFDLLYGLPGQTNQSVIDTARRTISLLPDRIAWYGYAHVPWMKPAQAQWSESDLPSGETKRALYETGREILLEAGYQEIGMDHFALPEDLLARADREGTLSRNFMGYVPKRQLPLLGLGISAIGEGHGMFVQNEKSLADYQHHIEVGRLPIMRGHTLSQEDLILREKIIEILAQKSTSLDRVAPFVLDNLRELHEDGLIEMEQDSLTVTELGIPLIRVIAAAFDQYRSKEEASKFSKVI